MKILFDITNYNSAICFLEEYLNVEKNRIERYISQNNSGYDVNTFLEGLDINLREYDINNMEAVVLQVTTNPDNNGSIKRYGLLNLQQTLSLDTPLKRYLQQGGIRFDISNNIMWVQDKKIDIKYSIRDFEDKSKEEKINNIAHKIYYDYQINGFLFSKNPVDYGGGVEKRPEILYNIQQLCKSSEVEAPWIKNIRTYIVEFKVPIEQLAYFTFYNTKDDYIEDEYYKEELKVHLVEMALRVSWCEYYGQCCSDIYAYLKPEVLVPYSSIIKIKEVKRY